MIHQIQIPELAASSIGLRAVTLRGLDRVVLLAGPNGAGKSRYLRLVSNLVRKISSFHEFRKKAEKLGQKLNWPPVDSSNEAMKQLIGQIENLHAMIGTSTEKIKQEQRDAQILWELFQGTKTSELCNSVFINYDGLSGAAIHDRERECLLDLRNIFLDIEQGVLKSAYRGIYVYLGYIAQVLYDSEHPRAKNKMQLSYIESAKEFNRMIRGLLDTEITYELNSHSFVVPFLFNRPFSVKELSEGQLILLAWAITIHQQSDNLSNAVLFIDEPETHLHADMCIEALERLRTEVLGEYGQMWIATHCPAILAHYGVQSLYYVKDSSIEYAGTGRVEQVMDSILGGKDGREKLAMALLDAEHVAFATFAAQCVLAPTIAEHRSDDPQELQFASALSSWLTGSGRTIRLLDFAAGKGRFAAALSEQQRSNGGSWRERIEYHIYNNPKFTPPDARHQCKQLIAALSDSAISAQRYWESQAELKATCGSTFDLVVLANVLHEIEITDWKSVFLYIADLLSSEGRLLIIEDLLPPVGELPNMWGYLILDRCGFETLFGGPGAVRSISSQNNRLLAIEVQRQHVVRVDHTAILKAIEYLKQKAKEEILQLRAVPVNERNHHTGRRHAHYAMLHTNASLALERL